MTNRVMLVIVAVVIGSTAGVHAQVLQSQPDNAAQVAEARPTALAAQPTADDLRRDARRFGAGVLGGVGIDPELIAFGAHGTFGPVLARKLAFRPGIEVGTGEITPFLGFNLDFVYSFPGMNPDNEWFPFIGIGPTFGLSHRNLDVGDEIDDIDDEDDLEGEDDPNRFDFSDTDFNGGMNFIVGMRKRSGVFFEMRATAWGVSNIRLLAGFNF